MNLIKRLSIISIVTYLTACSSGFGLSTAKIIDQNNTQTNQQAQTPKPVLKDFDQEKDTLFDLMVAEVAAQRNQFNITLLNYIQQAHMTRDPEVIKRAINAAQYIKDIEAIKEMALLWSDVEPESIPAHQLLAFQYFYSKDYETSAEELDKILALEGDPRLDTFAIGSQGLPEEEKREILATFGELYEKYPSYYLLPYSIAFLHRQLKEYDEALIALQPTFQMAPEFSASSVLKANILYDQGKLQEAIDFTDKAFDKYPDDHNLGRLYASMLVEDKQLNKAEGVFESLIEHYPQAPSLKLSLGLVKLENNKIDNAKTIFEELLENNLHTNEAHFYLGRIAEQEKNIDIAISHYKQIQENPNYEASIERVSFLLAQQDKIDEMMSFLSVKRAENENRKKMLWLLEVKLLSLAQAKDRMMDSLNAAILDFPDDDQLLYARAMNLDAQDDLLGMEADLRKILEHKPDNAIALNALGYTLADKTDRLQEAFQLIQKAHVLEPENPAILDSMGWVLFKLNQREEALIFLLKAFQAYQDGEVAAHLGEVLWSLNQKTEAFEVWVNVLRKQPDHPILRETINRLAPEVIQQLEKPAEEAKEQSNIKKPQVEENHQID